MSDEKRGPRLSSDYLYVPGKKKRFPLASFIVLLLVVISFGAGGYYVHKGFSVKNNSGLAPINQNNDSTLIDSSNADSASADNTSLKPTTPVVAVVDSAESVVTQKPEKISDESITAALETAPVMTSTTNSSEIAVNPAQHPVVSDDANASDVAHSDSGVKAKIEPEASVVQTDIAALIKEADALYAKSDFNNSKELLTQAYTLSSKENRAAGKEFKYAVLYRLGLVNRQLKDEKAAQAAWVEAYNSSAESVYGRYSALALADTWYYWYVQKDVRYDQWEKIRNAYAAVLGMDGARFLDRGTDKRVAQRLLQLNQKLIFDPKMKTAGAVFHTVKPGEFVSTIARKYNLGTWTSITELNHIDPKRLRPGMVLKIMPGRMSILVDKKYFTLSWYLDGIFIKRYGCAIGAPETETPAGSYTIFKMDVEPTWTDPKTGKLIKYGEPGHLIGSRWLAMRGGSKNGLGIHGTVAPESIGTKASNGCVRLLNKNVEELYGFASIEPGNETEVLVIE